MANAVNCFHVKHRVSSAIICVFCSVLALSALITCNFFGKLRSSFCNFKG
ncbi:hypothetical protein CBL_08721 [Carabus blaptoides fortunei]